MIRLQRVKIIFMFTALIFLPCHIHVLHAIRKFVSVRVCVCVWQLATCKNSVVFARTPVLILGLLRTLCWRGAGGVLTPLFAAVINER